MYTQFLPADRGCRWPIVSQHPNVASINVKHAAEHAYLPRLVALWQAIESASGHRWNTTSYWRESPSHSRGEALDIAPTIHPFVKNQYAVYHGSDPVLYKREPLIRQLQQVARLFRFHLPYSMGIYIEPDHLHLQVIKPTGQVPEVRVFKWKQPKYAYADTLTRIQLPLIKATSHERPY